MYRLTSSASIVRLVDGAIIPPDPANADYAAYLAWVAAGGVPDPIAAADTRATLLDRLDRLDAQSVRPLRAVAAGTATDEDRAKLAAIEAEAVTLRAQLAG